MNKEDKEFLVKDLCARLPYGVKTITYIPHLEGGGETVERTLDSMSIDKLRGASLYPNEKPYLRPMPLMTEEERKEYRHLIAFSGSPEGAANLIDWLNKRMFAYRTIKGKDMFESGIALIAPDGMYE